MDEKSLCRVIAVLGEKITSLELEVDCIRYQNKTLQERLNQANQTKKEE
jgi:hypothetical protein